MRRLFDRVFCGNDEMHEKAVADLTAALEKYGPEKPFSFPDTAYNCAIIRQYLEIEVKTLGDLKAALDKIEAEWMPRDQKTEAIFHSGLATAMLAQIIEACVYIDNPHPYGEGNDPDERKFWGHMTDAEVRALGVPLVTEDIPGFVVLIGPAPSAEEARDTIKGYQSRGIFVFLIGGIIDQAREMGITMDFNVRVVPVGPEIWHAAHIVDLVMRAANIFGNIQPGDYWGMNTYTLERIRAFINAYAPVNDITVGAGACCICLGFPVITNDTQDVYTVPKSLCIKEDTKDWIETSLEARDIKIKVTTMDIPIAFNTAFEGEVIRAKQMKFDAYGATQDCFELVQMKDASEIEDHKITVIGPDFDSVTEENKRSFQLAYIAEVCGKTMQSDFESVFERKFHSWINCLEGVMHTGQREQIRIRVSNTAFDAGLRAKHFGEVLYAKLKNEYDTVIDKCQVTVITDPELISKLKAEVAMPAYHKRDARLATLTDEAVDVFYTCTMCQSFSPSHVCIVTPERLGLCGAVSWLDAKATNQLNPNGPCQLVSKEGCEDEKIGIWPDVNRAVNQYSQGHLEKVTLYSLFQDPMTSCGCFECICGMEPASMGVVIVDRSYPGSTPLGMSFAELASMTGGGQQTPGFMGHGKQFIGSKKFMRAEGGIARIVWMPSALKAEVADSLNAAAKDLYGIENFTDMVCDETIAGSADDLDKMIEFLNEKNHPVLGLEPFDM